MCVVVAQDTRMITRASSSHVPIDGFSLRSASTGAGHLLELVNRPFQPERLQTIPDSPPPPATSTDRRHLRAAAPPADHAAAVSSSMDLTATADASVRVTSLDPSSLHLKLFRRRQVPVDQTGVNESSLTLLVHELTVAFLSFFSPE